jgi:mono/diheme cytochrome c family protein
MGHKDDERAAGFMPAGVNPAAHLQKWRLGAALALCLLLPACQQEMARQPSYRPLEPSPFFPEGRSARPLVPGTVPRGRPLDDAPTVRGRKEAPAKAKTAGFLAAGPGLALAAASPGKMEDYVTTFPFPITEEGLKRGRERYTIFCAVCHGPVGNGNGIVVERGYLKPPSYHTDNARGFERWGLRVPLREAPVGYFYEVISQGYGGMPDYSTQVPPEDRWKIIAYIRALQWSQQARLDDLPPGDREKARRALETKP